MLWRSLYLRFYENQTPQREAWDEYLTIKEKEIQLRSYVNKLRQYVYQYSFTFIDRYFPPRELLELERKCTEKTVNASNTTSSDKDPSSTTN